MKTRYPNVYQDKKGKFFYQIFIGTDANGKKKLKKGRRDALGHPFSSAYQASKEAKRVQALYANVSADNISYAAYMKNQYLPKYRGDVEASTYETHNLMLMKGVDFLGDTKLKNIKVSDCEKYRTWLLTDAEFSRNYASVIYTAFRQSLDYAVEIGLIATNPSLKTKSIPKGRTVEKYWTKPEFEKVLAYINTDSFYEQLIYVTFLFYYRIGCRVNEGFALRWSDIDFETNTISITRNVTTGLNNRPYISNGKTANSVRRIPVDSETMNYLKEWRYCQQKDMLKKGFNFLDADNYIFPTINNGITSLSKPRQWNKSICDKFGLRRIKIHGFRHTHASLCYSAGLNAKEIQKRLGHADSKTTMNVYTHVMKNDEKKAVKKFADFMK